MEPHTTSNESGKRDTWVSVVIILAILAGGFFILTNKNGDVPEDSMLKKENGSAHEGEAMMEEGEAMMAKHTITYTDAGFSPDTLDITIGETVTFVNESNRDMWVASAIHPTHQILPEFDQDEGTPRGSTYSFTFTKAGAWKFHDHLNPGARGTITVK